MRNDVINDEFIKAARDFAYLMNQQYPRKAIQKLVGDRYLLNTYQRILLSRGIFRDPGNYSRTPCGYQRETTGAQ